MRQTATYFRMLLEKYMAYTQGSCHLSFFTIKMVKVPMEESLAFFVKIGDKGNGGHL